MMIWNDHTHCISFIDGDEWISNSLFVEILVDALTYLWM